MVTILWSGMVIHDMPYGLGFEPWDNAPLSQDQLTQVISRVRAVVNKSAWVYVCYYPSRKIDQIMEVLTNANFPDLAELFWYKTNQVSDSLGKNFIWAMEHLIVGFFGGRNNVPWPFGPNTYDRHNLLVGPNVNARLMNDQVPVNRHEKPAWITRLLAASFCSPGDTVLVLGAGAGGDVAGLLAAGMNVIGLENDPAQFPFLSGRINTLANNCMTHKGSWDKTLPQAFVGRFGIPPKDIPVVKHVHAPKEDKIEPLPGGSESSSSSSSPAEFVPEARCSNCGGGFTDDDKAHKCGVCGFTYHFACFYSTDKTLVANSVQQQTFPTIQKNTRTDIDRTSRFPYIKNSFFDPRLQCHLATQSYYDTI